MSCPSENRLLKVHFVKSAFALRSNRHGFALGPLLLQQRVELYVEVVILLPTQGLLPRKSQTLQ